MSPQKQPRNTERQQNGYHTIKTLAAEIYKMPYDTFRSQLTEIKDELKGMGTRVTYRAGKSKKRKTLKGVSRYLNQKQLALIVNTVGEPPHFTWDGKKFIAG